MWRELDGERETYGGRRVEGEAWREGVEGEGLEGDRVGGRQGWRERGGGREMEGERDGRGLEGL